MTPLISIVNNLSAGSQTEKEYQNMIRLLLLHWSIDVNICEQNNNNTALHLAMCFQQKKVLQLLLSHPNINPCLTNKAHQNSVECARRNRAEHLIIEIQKALKGKELLNALSDGNVRQAKALLNQELNPNCWKRTYNGKIETPLSLIIKSCLQGITQDNEEVLIKLLKHKDLDFSYEQYAQLKQTIEQAIKERLTGTINEKDLDDVKKLVEDNCFMNHAVVTAALRNVNNPIESITNYLNEKFSANTNNIPKDFEGFVEELVDELVDELERTKAQLTETEQELANKTSKISQLEKDLVREKLAQKTKIDDLNSEISRLKIDLERVREERDGLSSENRLLRTKSLSNKNEKPSRAISPGQKQSNCASASFVLSGAFVVGACLAVLYDYPVIGACLTAVALVLFLAGYYLCKADERDIRPGGTTNNPQVTRVFTSSPNSAENFYTY